MFARGEGILEDEAMSVTIKLAFIMMVCAGIAFTAGSFVAAIP